MLGVDLLDDLRRNWESQGASIVSALRPGVDGAEMGARAGAVGLTLSDEARTWWGWRDGAAPGAPTLGPGLYLMSLEAAIDCRQEMCDIAAKEADSLLAQGVQRDAEEMWRASWIPLAHGSGSEVIVCDCEGPPGAPSPIYVVAWEGGLPTRPVLDSVESLVRLWIDAMRTGLWTFDPDYYGGNWRRGPDTITPEHQDLL